jgi:hypothetical protein
LSSLGTSLGLCWFWSWGVSSFDSSCKHKTQRKSQLDQWMSWRGNKVRK